MWIPSTEWKYQTTRSLNNSSFQNVRRAALFKRPIECYYSPNYLLKSFLEKKEARVGRRVVCKFSFQGSQRHMVPAYL